MVIAWWWPMMVVPLAYDQPAVALLVTRRGLGIVCPPGKLTPQGLVAHLDELLGEPKWRSTPSKVRPEPFECPAGACSLTTGTRNGGTLGFPRPPGR